MNEAILNQLLKAPVMPDTESFFFPHDDYPVTDESKKQAIALLENSRTVVDDDIKNYLFDGEYRAESVEPKYRASSDFGKSYVGIPDESHFSIRVAIQAFIVFSSFENNYLQDIIQFKELEKLTHVAPFPTHPHIIEICINGEPITAQSQSVDATTLDQLMKNVEDFFGNCVHGGGYIPYLNMDTEIYY